MCWLGKQILSYSKLGIHIKSAYFSCQDVIHFLRQVEKMVIRGANFSSKTSGKDIVYTISIISMNKMVVYISLKTFQRQFLLFIWVIFHEWKASKICLPKNPQRNVIKQSLALFKLCILHRIYFHAITHGLTFDALCKALTYLCVLNSFTLASLLQIVEERVYLNWCPFK